MRTQLLRLAALTGLAIGLMVVSTDSAFALGRSKHSGYKGWTNSNSSNNTGGTNNTVVADENPIGGGDSNPVPEPASMMLLGSALAGFSGYRGLRKKFGRK